VEIHYCGKGRNRRRVKEKNTAEEGDFCGRGKLETGEKMGVGGTGRGVRGER